MAMGLSSMKPALRAAPLPSAARAKHLRRARGVVSSGVVAEPVTEPVTASEIIDVEFLGQEDDGRLVVRGTMELAASAGDTWAAVTDHSRAPEIFSNIAASTAVPVDGKLEVSQQCTWKFLMFRGSFNIVTSVEEQPESRQVDFSLVESKFMRAFQGSWAVQERPGGGCVVMHTLQVTPLVSPPPAFAGYTSKIFIKQVTGIMEDLQEAMTE